jgi:hypothetical protein
MEYHVATQAAAVASRQGIRVRIISLLGPLVVVGGLVWAVIQPYRLTILHPYHQGFWWLAIEPPLLAIAAGVFFSVVVARPLLDDLMEGRRAAAE